MENIPGSATLRKTELDCVFKVKKIKDILFKDLLQKRRLRTRGFGPPGPPFSHNFGRYLKNGVRNSLHTSATWLVFPPVPYVRFIVDTFHKDNN
jgi:hypothetical protein